MESWVENTIDELSLNEANSVVDGPFGSNLKVSDFVENGIPVLQGGNITGDKFRFENIRFISKGKAKTLFRSNAIVGDLITVKIGSVGYSAIIDNLQEYPYAIIPANLMRSRFNPKRIRTKYIYFFLTSERGKKALIDLASNTAQPALSLGNFKGLKVTYPKSLPEQTRLAEILSTADEAIEQTEKLIAKYQRIKTGLMQDLLSRGIDEHGNIRGKATHKFVVKNGIEVPEEWEVKELGAICDIKGRIGWQGYTVNDLTDDAECPTVIGGTQISKEHKLDFTKSVFLKRKKYLEAPEIFVRKGDIILVKTGSTIGKTALVDTGIGEATINPNTVILKNFKDIINKYLYLIMISDYFQKSLWDFVFVGAQPSVNQTNTKTIKIPVPKEGEQFLIVERFFALMEQIDQEIKKLSKLHSIKTGLMQDLLSGRVRVKVEESEMSLLCR